MSGIRKRITIKDIARELGISPSTVSRALNDHPAISERTKEMVKKKAREMGYVLFQHARTLKTRKSMTVGVIVPDIRNPFFLDFLDGAERVLFPRKYKMLLSTSNEDTSKESVYLKWLIEHGIDGILVSPAFDRDGRGNLKLLLKIKKMGIPVVLYDRIFEERRDAFDSVTIDNEGAIVEAMRYLHSMGHVSVGIILADTRIYTVRKRYEGFMEGCRTYGMRCPADNVLDVEQPFSTDKSLEKICGFFRRADLSAVIATNHFVTKMIYKCLKRLKISIPDEVSVIGFDDVEENEFFSPPVTVIKQPVLQMGKAAATLLLGRIDGETYKTQSVVLKAEFVERYSVRESNSL